MPNVWFAPIVAIEINFAAFQWETLPATVLEVAYAPRADVKAKAGILSR